MAVKHLVCGAYANNSERYAVEFLKVRLQNHANSVEWALLSNYSNSTSAQYLSDELDLVVIGPSGVVVVEIKHWSSADMKDGRINIAESEADKLNEKAKRLKGKLQRACKFDVGFVEGKFLFTKSENEKFAEGIKRRRIRGIGVYGLTEWKDLLDVNAQIILTNDKIAQIAKTLQPQVAALGHDEIKNFDNTFFELTPVKGLSSPFRRIYRARRQPGRDKVILHIYDLTALSEKNSIEIARREFQILQRLQTSKWLPNLMDSFQEAKHYPGELYFFSYVDTESPTLTERTRDKSWSFEERLYACLRAIEALEEIHAETLSDGGSPILHRNITPDTVHIRSNGKPLLTQLHLAKLPGAETVAGVAPEDFGQMAKYFAPEVLRGGIGMSTIASDVYSLCSTLSIAFSETPLSIKSPESEEILNALSRGLNDDPAKRPSLAQVYHEIADIVSEPEKPDVAVPDVQFWDESTIVDLNHRSYKIITKLGSGGFGITFKVMEVDPTTGDDLSGPYVAKAITNETAGSDAATAYAKVRAQTGTDHLAGVLEVASQWHPNSVTALLKWINGIPLDDLKGVLQIHLEDFGHTEYEDIILLWLTDMCGALSQLHSVGLVHGDVSPKNIIVDGTNLTLTDFDTAAPAMTRPLGMTPYFCSPEVASELPIEFSDDLFALAASFFSTVFDRIPFEYDDGPQKSRGLNWNDIDQLQWRRMKAFCDKATSANRTDRFSSAMDAKEFLARLIQPASAAEGIIAPDAAQIRTDNIVPWLSQLLQSYPGSPKGNAETRGLDSEFAKMTYVETALDEMLARDIREKRVSLVILCGNAGDGKTAFLQNLGANLGVEVGASANRIWNFTLPDGLKIYANLDGSAAYQGRSANELLDECLAPFQSGEFPKDTVHLLAINDGKLLEWLEEQDETVLADQLYDALGDNSAGLDPRTRFIDLNKRSLVGGFQNNRKAISAIFIEKLLEKMLGQSTDIWSPCQSCTAQMRCHAWASVTALRDSETAVTVKRRLVDALLAVHQRGEIHITARNLRAALVYIFFGILDCQDLHGDPNLFPEMYYDRAFDYHSPLRQGDLLSELSRLDPALESHPEVDRLLLRTSASELNQFVNDNPSLDSLRRKAYFEWSAEEVERVSGSRTALALANSQHAEAFLRIGTGDDDELRRICSQLCEGIARLEDLPVEAFEAEVDAVPLKITPRTPTETAFWVSKARDRFSLRPSEPLAVDGIETLHTHVVLSYQFENGHHEELIIGAELFNLLLELREGFQVSDVRSDEIFANLSIFKQRIAQEGDRLLFAWNPAMEQVMKLSVMTNDGIQQIHLQPVFHGVPK
ncbi:MAG: NERD domain-containing protein [Pyrinomonadaceae bacterium]